MDEAAMVARANEEREKLFQRYERGREPGADIDPWEDPAYEVYHQTDRYGFIHDKRLPQQPDPNEAKARSIEMERVKKWLKMTAKWDDRKTRDQLHKRIFKGVPDKMRSRVWVKLLGVEQVMASNRNVYANMLKLARAWSTEARQIDSDVNRQFREHWIYRERYSIKQRSLFNVLTAYSMYNSEVGYCQGMSGVAGVLLMYMNEEEAFWALCTILADKRYAMHGLYIEGFPKLTRFLAHHDVIIGKFMPKLKKHFDMYNLDSILYSLKWFFVIFIERIPFSLCLRVWDIYLMDGERVVTAMAYTILRLHKNKLLKLKDMDLIVQYIQTKLHKDFDYDDDYVIKMLEQSMEELRKAKLDLPPPPAPNEFPQKPFGVFVEPNFEAKVGIRKSIFSDTEKEVTDTVIMRRELTVQELQEVQQQQQQQQQTSSTSHASNGQLNSSGIVPESEDGGSLLGSSRKSLADTSVTSTADLSVFSTGPRSQQAFDICVDDARSVRTDQDDEEEPAEGDENGELSPGSAFCSLSIVGRTPSAMMVTPTPRAMSPLDVVRIYVPPAPPDEAVHPQSPAASTAQTLQTRRSMSASNQSLTRVGHGHHQQQHQHSPQHSQQHQPPPSQYHVFNGSREALNNQHHRRISTTENGDRTPTRRRSSIHQSNEELNSLMHIYGTSSDALHSGGANKSTSSSRRGSLSRKSPSTSLLHEHNRLLIECAHIRRSSGALHVSVENVQRPGPAVLMTSFEELALKKQQQQIRASQESLQLQHQQRQSSSRYVSESNIEYQPLRRPSLTQNGGGGSASDVLHSARAYSRYSIGQYVQDSADVQPANDDDDDDEDNRRSSDESSTSPNSKSVLNTPVNETLPLLLTAERLRIDEPGDHDDEEHHQHQQHHDRHHNNHHQQQYQHHARHQPNQPNISRIPHLAASPPAARHPSTASNSSSTTSSPPPSASSSMIARPSRIPLKHQRQPVDSSSAAVLPPVEVPSPQQPPLATHSAGKRLRQQVPMDVRRQQVAPPAFSPFSAAYADLDSRIAAPLGGVYQYAAGPSSAAAQQHRQTTEATTGTTPSSASGIRKPTDLNKIRIKINQSQRN